MLGACGRSVHYNRTPTGWQACVCLRTQPAAAQCMPPPSPSPLLTLAGVDAAMGGHRPRPPRQRGGRRQVETGRLCCHVQLLCCLHVCIHSPLHVPDLQGRAGRSRQAVVTATGGSSRAGGTRQTWGRRDRCTSTSSTGATGAAPARQPIQPRPQRPQSRRSSRQFCTTARMRSGRVHRWLQGAQCCPR